MKQILQNLRTGEMQLADLPCPRPSAGQVLIQTRASVISAGTERMLVEFSQANLLQKARQQPEKVKQVLDKIRTDGLMPTLDAVFRKLDEPLPLGYCNAGVVLETGSGVSGLEPGDRVISNGSHAEVVCVPRHLCAKVPDSVPDEQAAFTVIGAIALQGVRLALPTLGERFVVFGMGLVGLLTVQLLRAHGCEVLAVDLDEGRLNLAERLGARVVNLARGGDPIVSAEAWTHGVGVDGAIVTASAKTDDIIHQAAQACRKRGRIVLVGVVGLNLRRDDFYKKELTFQVSCSYGPGRYDEAYEQGGQDYPIGFARWTEQRNFEAVLAAMAAGGLRVGDLITHRFPLAEAVQAYECVQKERSALGVVIEYPTDVQRSHVVRVIQHPTPSADGAGVTVGVIGAGGFARGVMLPAMVRAKARLAWVAAKSGASARHAADKFKIEQATTDYRTILDDPSVQAVFILVGHHLHARMICEALAAGKHVFVEKPLALNEEELLQVAQAVSESPDRLLALGLNRRFSPHTVKIRELLAGRSEPISMTMTINAGSIPSEHWIQDPDRGGGRIIGEGCHFIDLAAFIAGSRVEAISAVMMGEGPAVREDKMSMSLRLSDGSIATINYFSNGPKNYPKEMLEIFSEGRVLRLENFRVTRGFGFNGFTKFKSSRQDKGHIAEAAQFLERAAHGGDPIMGFDELANITLASFAAVESARSGGELRRLTD